MKINVVKRDRAKKILSVPIYREGDANISAPPPPLNVVQFGNGKNTKT